MLGLIFIAVWVAFVGCYLIWQQISGDLAPEAMSEVMNDPMNEAMNSWLSMTGSGSPADGGALGMLSADG